MTSVMDMLPPDFACRSSGSNDFVPLIVVAAVLLGLRFAVGRARKRGRNPVQHVWIVALLVVAVGVVFAVRQRQGNTTVVSDRPAALPRLVDLGADKCIPCKMMAPILEDLSGAYAGKLAVEFIDVWKNPAAGQEYGIRVIPTQVFFSPDGKELFRHEGFLSKEDILAKWKELGHAFE